MAAAGEAFLSATFKAAIEILNSTMSREFGKKLGIDKDLIKLRRTLTNIHAVLNDAEAKQINEDLVQNWLSDLKEVAYDADDLVDEVATQAELLSQQKKQVSNFDKDTLVNKLQEINERLKEIDEDKEGLGLIKGVKSTSSEMGEKETERLTSSLVDESRVFGRKKDKDKVAKLLMSDEEWRNDVVFGVVPIVGLGGLGKTTLAQLVYNDEFVRKHFDVKIWICVSDDFDSRRLTKLIIESINQSNCDLMALDVLQTKLQDLLRGKKFLLVLDDVWNDDPKKWESLRLPFGVGAPGSRIVVTTRSEKVAKIMTPIQPYNLEVLSEHDCWLLFKERAFLHGNEDAYPNLVPIGKEILKKCKGLPLAAKTLGGLLHSKTEVDEWNTILRSDIWDLENEEVMPALRLSYNNLPACLKQCFMYCSIFPKDYNFNKDNLISLWMAEGFVQKGKQPLEKVASQYFDDLWLRSFFQKSKTDSSKFVMHDLIHDLAMWVAGEICCSLEGEKLPSNPGKIRHSSVLVNIFKSVGFDAFRATKGLRTMIFLSNKNSQENTNITVPDDLVSTLKCLRSWDLSYISIKELPYEMGNLIHMRYLDLSHTHISKLPESTCSLYNLQTLILVACNKLLSLPEGTQELIKLRHLDLTGCWHLKSMPPNIGKLTSIQKLHRFVAGKESGCRISELKNMNELQATLCIDRIEDVVCVEEAEEANLKKKEHIKHLVLRWSRSHRITGGIDEELLECLEPHVNLKSFKIDVYPGTRFPSWMGNSLLNQLEKIEFFHCNYCQVLPPLGQLPFLKELTIHMMSELETIGHEFYGEGKIKGFPSLEKLKLEDMRNLKKWQEIELGEFPMLQELSISNCPNISNLPTFPKIRELVLDDCHELILTSIQFLTTLSSLKISHFRSTGQLPESILQPLNLLEELKIHHFYRLKELRDEVGLQNLPSVRSLEILCCPKLLAFPKKGVPATLQHLSIGVCNELKDLPNGIQNLSSLEELSISKCPKLVAFPKERLPVSLKNLRISACANLESLPMGLHDLSRLEHFSIESCRKIASLPNSGLPHNLKQLSVRECPLLEERCQEGGADWDKIKDIPNKRI